MVLSGWDMLGASVVLGLSLVVKLDKNSAV